MAKKGFTQTVTCGACGRPMGSCPGHAGPGIKRRDLPAAVAAKIRGR